MLCVLLWFVELALKESHAVQVSQSMAACRVSEQMCGWRRQP